MSAFEGTLRLIAEERSAGLRAEAGRERRGWKVAMRVFYDFHESQAREDIGWEQPSRASACPVLSNQP